VHLPGVAGQLRCKKIWVVGANRWRNPADDLPTDFEDRRVEHYQALRKPLDPTAFIGELREEIRTELDALHWALPTCDWLEISDRASGTIKLTPLDAAPEPRNLRQLKQAVQTRWRTVPELGRAQKTTFLARYLRSRQPQREIHEGLNMVESWNRANAVIFYGKGGDLASNHRDEQEMSVLCLRILQAALVCVNTLMLQDLLAEPDWDDVLTPEDRRGLTPRFWSHVLPYGEVKLNMTSRLPLSTS
jgi:hypothetical protein